MIISNEHSKPILVESIDVPTFTEYFWGFDLINMDFMLQELKMFEEIQTPVLVLEILNYIIIAPANWNVLVYSRETSQLDVAELKDLTRGGFTVLLYDHTSDKIVAGEVKVIDWKPNELVRTPTFKKNMMLCHHVGPKYWACLSASDIYNKYLKNKVIGDLMY